MNTTQDNSVVSDIFSDLLNSRTTGVPDLGAPVIEEAVQGQPEVTVPVDAEANIVEPSATDPSTATPEESVAGTSNWDDELPETTGDEVKATPSLDWTQIGKAIGIEEAKSSEDVVGYVNSLKKSIEEIKSKAVDFEGVPSELVEALEIAKNNGDYLSYLDIGKIDYSQVDPIELFEDEVAEYFYNPDGTFREQEYNDYLDRQDEFDMRLRGTQIQKALINEQLQQKAILKQKIASQKQENLRKLESSLTEFKKVGEYDVTPKAKKQLYQDLTTGKFLDKMGINLTGSHNWSTLLNTYFKALYFDAIVDFNQKAAKNATLRKEMGQLSNSTVGRPSGHANPVATQKKEAIDLYFENKGIKK